MDTSLIWQIAILIVLLIMSGFFSMSETALMSLSKIRIRHMVEEGVKGAKLVEKLTEDPNRLLGAILIGNNVVNIGASALATTIATKIFGSAGAGIATGVMTILVLIFGEITPKSIAKQKSEKVALRVSKIINIIVKILKPFIGIFTAISSIFIRMFGGDPKASEPFITEEELRTMVGVSEEEGVLEDVEKEMIFNVFDFADAHVKDVMVQRVDIIFEFKKIKELFSEMKKTRNHISVVLDEYGGTVGIVTIEDLIEEVFGDIEDEYDDYEKEIEVIKEDEYVVDGSARLDDISELIGVNMESEEFDSVGGLVIGELGRFPEQNEEVQLNNIRFVVEEIDKNRIKKVRIYT